MSVSSNKLARRTEHRKQLKKKLKARPQITLYKGTRRARLMKKGWPAN